MSHGFAQDGYSLFFTDQHQNPAISSHLKSHYVDVQAMDHYWGARNNNSYSLDATANASLNSINSNVGLMYNLQDYSPHYLKNELSLNLGHSFDLTDSTRLSVGLNATWGQREFPLNDRNYSYSPNHPSFDIDGVSMFTENLGVWYESPNYYAGFSARNFLVTSKHNALFEQPSIYNPYQFRFNGMIARHFSLGNVRLSPTVQYRVENEDPSMSHFFRPGIVTQIHDKYTLGFKAQTRELNRDITPFFREYQVEAGVEFWDNLLIRAQADFFTGKFSGDDIIRRVGAGVSWFLGEDLINNGSGK